MAVEQPSEEQQLAAEQPSEEERVAAQPSEEEGEAAFKARFWAEAKCCVRIPIFTSDAFWINSHIS